MFSSAPRNATPSVLRIRKPTKLPESLHRHLNSYALAASAAGVTLLACSLPVGAVPVCKNLTVRLAGTDTYSLNPASQQFAPFNIAHTFNNASSLSYAFWNRGFLTPNSARAAELLGGNGFPAALASGANIGPGGHFGKGKSYGMLFSYGPLNSATRNRHQGNFQFGQTNYFGFRFSLSGENHFGWVRLKVTFGPGFDGTATYIHIRGYGYETAPNTGIRAGQCSSELSRIAAPISNQQEISRVWPETHQSESIAFDPRPISRTSRFASLGLLALGACGLRLWRRKENEND
jgi:hypothetical protein